MSDLEEGEIEGPPPPPPPQQSEQIQQQRPPALSPHDEDKVLAPRPSGRAPYYSGADTNGFKGRGGGGGGKKKRKKAAAAAAAAAGFVDVYGKGASAAIELHHEQGPIRLPDVQNLLLWVLGQGANPRWCFVKNKPLVKKVLLLVAHGLDAASWEAAAASGALPAWRAHLGQPIELQARNATLAPGSTVHSLLTVPQTKKRRREDDPQQQAPAGAAAEASNAAGPAAGVSNGALPAAEARDATAAVGPGAAAAAGNGSGNGDRLAAAEEAQASADPAAAADEARDSAAAAKRMKVAAADDVSSRVQPQLAATTGQTPAQQPGAGQLAQELDGQQPQQQTQQAQQQAQQEQQAPRHAGRGGSHPLPPAHYVLSLDELQEHGYPLPRFDAAQGEMVCPEGFVATRATKAGAAAPHDLVALDCEMCITDAGFELTRATLLDGKGQVLLDELCVPANPITDHNTRFSGITAEMLEGVATRLGDVQARFRELVAAETLVVAHSGENDLQALKIIHANVIDTAVLFPHPRGPPFKSALRVLASRHLLRTIQTGEHDPVEDARAALDLALLKFERGPGYGAASTERGEKLVEVLGSAGRRSTMVDRLELLNRQVAGNCAAVVADDDAAVVAALARELPKTQVHFLWGQLTALHRCYEARLAATKASGAAEPSQAYLLPRFEGGQEQQLEQQQQQQQQQQQRHQQDQPQQDDGPEPEPEAEQPPAGQGQAVEVAAQDSAQQQPASQEQQRQQQGAGHKQHVQPHEQALAELDAGFAALWAAAPAGTLLVVVTGQGDTAYCRYLQEQKWRRQQQQQQQQDGLLPWSPACEAHLAAWQSRVQSALCFAAVKGAAPQQDEQLAGQQQQQNGQGQQGGEQSLREAPQG